MIRNSQNQVCNIELAEKLYNLGVKQESIFYWRKYQFCKNADLYYIPNKETDLLQLSGKLEKNFSAFTSSELGEMLPQIIFVPGNCYCGDSICNNFWLDFNRDVEIGKIKIEGWIYFYTNGEESKKFDYDKDNWDINEANARARLLIYLIENGLYKKKD
jgi:hypothetical protein